MNRPVALLALLASVVVTAPAGAATIVPTTSADGIANDGKCSLREAVIATNTDAAVGGCAAGAGADTIALPAGVYGLSIAGSHEGASAKGDLDVTAGTLTIAGGGAGSTTIDGGLLDRVLDVAAGATLTVDGVTLTDGAAPGGAAGADDQAAAGVEVTGGAGAPGEGGGAIRSAGALTVRNSVVAGNRAGAGGHGGNGTAGNGTYARLGRGGNGGPGGRGGGILATGSLTVSGTTLTGNSSGAGGAGGNGNGSNATLFGVGGGDGDGGAGGISGEGGGIAATGALTVAGSTLMGNATRAGGPGGAGSGGNGADGAGGSGAGAPGGDGHGGPAGDSGRGGGLWATGTAGLSATTIARNHTGQAGLGGPSSGGFGGTGSGPNGDGGGGGENDPGAGGSGGAGGGAVFTGKTSLANVTLDENRAGDGGRGGAPFPFSGTGGNGIGTGTGGKGGASFAGDGGAGGTGGAIYATNEIAAGHVTVSGNAAGVGRPAGNAFPGLGGDGGTHGANGGSDAGSGGNDGDAGATVTLLAGKAAFSYSVFDANSPDDCRGQPLVNAGHDVQTSSDCAGALVGAVRLAPLDDNGGPVWTRALQPGSPALDLASTGCAASDARGVSRPRGGGCDAGAYERAAPDVVTGAPVSGTVAANGRAASYHFEYGTTTAYDSRTAEAPVSGVAPVAVSTTLSGLAPATLYHYRLVASNGDGSSVGADASFTTPPGVTDMGGAGGAGAPGDGGSGGNPGGGGGGGIADTVAPVLSKVSAKPRRFRLRRGTVIRFRLSEAAKVTIKVGRLKRVTVNAHAGANKKRFKSRRKLKPGKYRVTLVATDAAGNRSKAKRLKVRVLRPRAAR